MPGFGVVGGLDMDMDVAVARREHAAMLGRVKADNGGFNFFQLEGDLNLLMHSHVVWSIPDAIYDMKFDEILASVDQEGHPLFGIQTGSGGRFWNEVLKLLERTDVRRNRNLTPPRNLGPDKKRHARFEALGHLDRAVGGNPCQRRSAIRNRHLAPKLLDGTDTIEMLPARQGVQVQNRGEPAIHDCLALTADEPKIVSGSLDSDRTVGSSIVSKSTKPQPAACGTTTHGKTRLEKLAARNHEFSPQAAMLAKTGRRLRDNELALGTALASSLTQGSSDLRR